MERFLIRDLDLVRVNLRATSHAMTEDVWSSVETDGGRTRFGFDILLRPSRASRRSVTPSPRVDRAKLCKEIFSIRISAGEILRSGDVLSARKVDSNPGELATVIHCQDW